MKMLIVFLTSFFIAGTCGFLTVEPENFAVTVGTKVIMKCRTNDTEQKIFWRAPETENLPKKIFNGKRLSPEWSHILCINNSFYGQYDLIINSTMSSGTQYVCQEGNYGHINDSEGSAELVVLAANPHCCIEDRIEGGKIKLTDETILYEMLCTVEYSGNWIPLMEWRQEGFQEPMTAGVNTTVQNGSVISALTVSANVNNSLTRYIFTTRFDRRHKPSSTTADNIPNYTYNWTSPIIISTKDNPVTESLDMKTITSSLVPSMISVVAILQGTLLVVLVVLIVRRRINNKKTQHNNRDLDVVREAHILQDTGHEILNPLLRVDLYDTVPPTYAAVRHPNTAQTDYRYETSQRLVDSSSQHTNIGADGTQYTELPAMKSPRCSQQQQPSRSLFNKSIYARIDHTNSAPPPPQQHTFRFLH